MQPGLTTLSTVSTDSSAPTEWQIEDGRVRLWPRAFDVGTADRLYDSLLDEIDWQTEDILIFGQRRRVPRLVAWCGDPAVHYTYSGTTHASSPWTPALFAIRDRVFELSGVRFNSVLLNRYRDGRDGMGWHADDEPELGRDPVIVSVSLGDVRRFKLRHRRRREQGLDLDLAHVSVLEMSGPLQHNWLHALPKTSRQCKGRINLTWRCIISGNDCW
jgi:alkylated DNA repair dioxygenase AlkB